ncbi:DUF7563 family protein [Natronococcus occultus]|uniref:Small CPxCG-related zinc finger protein n=1 Tax=Natronococcus occultus SP4 TaxID=694430 RepID=L0K3T6_9EURY|nr:hypothetical protein [Natronococcus occultus]AGB38763.1 hypothetical protein Natoc_3012 [Natronococcus occultus SP4]
MPNCQSCGGYVTRDFVRVFGGEGTVAGCPNCTTYRELHADGGVEDTTEASPWEPKPDRPA